MPLTPFRAAALYLAAALLFTWPLVAGLTRDIPWDLGDSLLNAWILTWDADHVLRFASGDTGALNGIWNANIFHPEPLTLAYSEHLFAQAIQILPVYALTGNIILCYNLLFLSTFVLSGLGVYLFVREVTGSARAGFVAGLIYAFAPYRVPQFAHLQVISSQWMPFALYGLRRYFDGATAGLKPGATYSVTGATYTVPGATYRPLIGAGTALVAQNLSNGYFLLFFSPIVAAYVLFEVATRRLWRDTRTWTAISTLTAAVALLTLPFMLPYLELRRLGFPPRPLTEVLTYSADVYSYLTAPVESRVWGQTARAFPRAEGELFPALSALVLATVACIVGVRRAWLQSRGSAAVGALRPVVYLLVAVSGAYALVLVLILAGIRLQSLAPPPFSVRGVGRPFLALAVGLAALVTLSPRARSFARAWLGTITAFALLAALVAFVLSLGPEIRSNGRLIGATGPYSLLYWHVPGFDGLRVPARYAMLVLLFLAIAAGLGAAAIERRFRRGGSIALALGLLAVVEAFPAPITVNGTAAEDGYAPLPARVYTGAGVPPVYRLLATLPSPGTVVVEFPFGSWGYELRYMFYSTGHWHPLLNGYSGTFPLSYSLRSSLLRHPLDSPDFAWQSLIADGATHAVVHERAYLNGEGQAIGRWLEERGSRVIAEFDGDRVFQLQVESGK